MPAAMTMWGVIGFALQVAWQIFMYLWGKAEAKAAAAKALAEAFATLEKQGYPIMTDILGQMGRSDWVDWDQVKGVQDGAKVESKPTLGSDQ